MPPFAAGLLVFSTSAAVLVIEILASRLLAPYVGETLGTYTAVIGTVLAGIALGAFTGGRLADRSDPRGLLGPAIVLGGALTLAIVPIVGSFGPALAGGGAASTVILTALAFFLPATVLSAVSPMVVKLQLGALAETGSVVGRLSALGTAGAIVGTFVTGFVLVAAFPSRPTLLVLGAAVVVGGLALHWALRGRAAEAGRQPLAAILVLGLLSAGAATVTPTPCEVETAYYCASVVEDLEPCEGLTLYLDTLRHSCIHPDDPTRLDFTYAQVMGDVITTMRPPGEPLDALHIGGAGFSLPRWLRATRPGSRSLVLELDADIVQLARDRLGLVTGDDLRVQVGDARTALQRQPEGTRDLVIGDAFGGVAVPWHLTTAEFVRDVRATLRPAGVYALNLIDHGDLGFARAEVATLRAVFTHVAVIAPPERLARRAGGNFVLVASDAPLAVDATLASNAARGDDDGALTGDALDAFVDGARVLRDDHAPVDQLLTPQP